MTNRMDPNRNSMSLVLCVTMMLLFSSCAAFTCPEHCSCVELQPDHQNHARCTSLESLRQLRKTSELHSLDLSSLNLYRITNQLDKLTNLSKLDLHNNCLSEINNLSTKRIRTLDLSMNHITSGKLSKIPAHVKHLNLSHNYITILTENFKRFAQLETLELAENPLNCTCETLEIRDWLQEKKVWTNTPILCMAPLHYKGRSWLQVPQSDVCDSNDLDGPRMLPISEVENDVMVGDDPNASLRSDVDEQIENEFLPVFGEVVRNKRQDATSDENNENKENISGNDETDDGSGDLESEITSPTAQPEEYEGSGDSNESEPISPIRIADNDDDDNDDQMSTSVPLASEPTISSTESSLTDLEPIIEDDETNVEEDETNVEETDRIADVINEPTPAAASNLPERADSNATYILLAILGIILILLILYVAAKRNRSKAVKNRRNNNDVESPAQEMLAMDKKNLGKPITNQVEFIPLIPEKHAIDKKPNLAIAAEPLLQKLSEAENENENEPNDVSVKNTNEPQPTNPKPMNGNVKPMQNGLHDDKVDSNGTDGHKKYQSISPKPSRYSPVYSHDTGRVKIKAIETTRPKTPILVTRSRSNAGDDKYENKISQ